MKKPVTILSDTESLLKFFETDAHEYTMEAYNPKKCPIFVYLKHRGIDVEWVTKTNFFIYGEVYEHSQIIKEFIHEIDKYTDEFGYARIVTAKECYQTLAKIIREAR